MPVRASILQPRLLSFQIALYVIERIVFLYLVRESLSLVMSSLGVNTAKQTNPFPRAAPKQILALPLIWRLQIDGIRHVTSNVEY